MSGPRVVHCKVEPFDVLVDRTTKWGNPFVMMTEEEREQVLALHEAWIVKARVFADIEELRGKTLGCWCAPRACHADALLRHANKEIKTDDQEAVVG